MKDTFLKLYTNLVRALEHNYLARNFSRKIYAI